MKNFTKKNIEISSFVILVFMLVSVLQGGGTVSTVSVSPSEIRSDFYNPVPYIHIVNNFSAADAAFNFPGDGTKFNPYIIQDYYITVRGTATFGIYIDSTSAYFIVRNNLIDHGVAGIHINHTSRGNVEGNIVTNATRGIVVESSDYTSITGNHLEDNKDEGIHIENSFQVSVSGNVFNYNDNNLNVIDCTSVTITNNNFWRGYNYDAAIILRNTNASLISGNTIENIGYGLSLYEGEELQITENSISRAATGMYLSEDTNATVFDNLVEYATTAIHLFRGDTIDIDHNTLQHNKIGITVRNTMNASVLHNSLFNHSGGISVESTSNTIVEANVIENSAHYAITRSYATSTSIVDNVIINGGMTTSGNSIDHFIYDHLENTTINGLPILYLFGVQDKAITQHVGQIILVSTENITLSDMDFLNGGGISIAFSTTIEISGNSFHSTSTGVDIYNVTQLEIRNNKFSDIWSSVRINTGQDVIFNDNRITRERYEITFSSISRLKVEYNEFSYVDYSFSIVYSDGVVVRGNNFLHGFYYGFVLQSGQDYSIVNNYFYNFTQVALGSITDGEVLSNVIVNNTGYGLALGEVYNIQIENNEIVNSTYYGIIVRAGFGVTVTGNNFINNAVNEASQGYEEYYGEYVSYSGNYWSDHSGSDNNGDGYYDQSYNIEIYGPSENTDTLPRTDPVSIKSAPSAIDDLDIFYLGQGHLLTWSVPADDSGAGITSYDIFRSTEGGNYRYLTTVTATSYTDTTLNEGVSYSYKVFAKNNLGRGEVSNEVSIISRISPEAPLTPTGYSKAGYAYLQWDDANTRGQQLIAYRIYRSQTSGSGYTFIGSTTDLQFADLNVDIDNTYYYVITTETDFKESSISSEISITVEAALGETETVTETVTESTTIISEVTVSTTITENDDPQGETTESSSVNYPLFWLLPILLFIPIYRKMRY